MQISIQKLDPRATLPTFAHADDAGMDICALEETVIQAGQRVFVKTGIAVAIPVGYVGLLWDKSGLARTYGLTLVAGVIDAGYRGEIQVGIYNVATEPVSFATGDKVAQLLVQPITHPEVVEVDTLPDTARGMGGFGSTGR